MLTDVLEALENLIQERLDDAPCGMAAAGRIMFYGDGIDAYGQQLAEFKNKIAREAGSFVILEADKENRYQTAEMTARAALIKLTNKEIVCTNDLQPEYMRATEAEQKLKDGSLARERAAKMARFKAR